MAQPAVSLAIRELEVFYNVRLFERMNRRVYLTEAGRTLRQYADTVLSQFQESVEILRESGTQGACRFGVHVTLGETRLAGILAHLAEALPEITVRASIHNSRETERMILQNELDFAVVDNVTVSPHYLVEPCAVRSWRQCAPRLSGGKELPDSGGAGGRAAAAAGAGQRHPEQCGCRLQERAPRRSR
ncbi:MAG: LysR family transcriptional regulator [Oscillibacter sp.]|nr:LysR family transcriptional regulator [Oscillibacter sp.]